MEDRLRRDRKYKAWWAVFLLSSVAAFFDKLSGAEWVEFNIYAFGLYMLGNGIEHSAKAWEARGETDESTRVV